MKPREMQNLLRTEISHCSGRDNCPLREVCGIADATGRVLEPNVTHAAKGDIAWTDTHREHRVTIVSEGIFTCCSSPTQRDEIVFALFGQGDTIGLAELYLPREIADTYYIRALTEARLCSFPAKALRRRLEELPLEQRERTLSCAMVNHSSAIYAQVETLSQSRVSDKVISLLHRLESLSSRQGRDLGFVQLTHADIAQVVATDRVSVSRALRKMESEGLVALGYRSVLFGPSAMDDGDEAFDYATNFFHPDTK